MKLSSPGFSLGVVLAASSFLPGITQGQVVHYALGLPPGSIQNVSKDQNPLYQGLPVTQGGVLTFNSAGPGSYQVLSSDAQDPIPPAQVTDLAVTDSTTTSLTLSWTDTGDDGSSGTATVQDLRYSLAPITASNWSTATVVPSIPVPGSPGTRQSKTVSGLSQGTAYYFALRIGDEVPNWSSLSNSVRAATKLPPDTTPPAAAPDLAVTDSTTTSLTLSWTDTGDDGSSGTAASQELRSSLAPITASNWSTATVVSNLPVPQSPGTRQSKIVSGLSQGTAYYFALRIGDEVPNWSPLSNLAQAATKRPPDTTPPAAVTNLAVTDSTTTSLTLTWTDAGDDGTSGRAATQELRYSLAPITAGNWSAATSAANVPAPLSPGTAQSRVVSGLSQGTTYYFAMKTADEVPNWSPLSNLPRGVTKRVIPPPADTTPPAAVRDLSIADSTETSLTFAWTVTGDDSLSGRASTQELRYSTEPITVANWSSATSAAGVPAPLDPGTRQNATITGLSPCTNYYFSLKVADEVSNFARLGNVLAAKTKCTAPPPPPPPPPVDTTPPAAVTDLAATDSTTTSLTLSWTDTGDDGTSGTASAQELRYSLSPITADHWTDATLVGDLPVPLTSGTRQSKTVTGLSQGASYYFALKVADEVPNSSPLSNAAKGTTRRGPAPLPPADTVPPSPVVNLAVADSTTTTLTLTWTDSGDDGLTGRASIQELRYYTSPISIQNWLRATLVSGTPASLDPGTRQSAQATGLNPGTVYYFALKVADEVPNWSPLSNVVRAVTKRPPDLTPPAAVTDLGVTDSTSTSLTLCWTASGDDGLLGRASTQELRMATAPITSGTWPAASLVPNLVAPPASGTRLCRTVTGLTPVTLYYFAVKLADEAGNWSAISNLAAKATVALPDAAPPGSVADLSVTDSTETSLHLAWSAPADSVSSGARGSRRIAAFEMRYSQQALNAANWAAAQAALPQPQAEDPGAPAATTLGSLQGGTKYFIAVRSRDLAGNWSPLSNVLVAATRKVVPPPPPPPPRDSTPPSAVTTLTGYLPGPSPTLVSLSWQVTGDDGTTGRAARCQVRRNTSPITEVNWLTSDTLTGVPVPADPGLWQSVSWSGGVAGATYYFAIKVADEVPNWSGVSNSYGVSIPQTPDASPLLPPTRLKGRWHNSSVDLSWSKSPSPQASRYRVLRQRSDQAAPLVVAQGLTQTAWSDGSVARGVTYSYAVAAEDAQGNTSSQSGKFTIRIPSGSGGNLIPGTGPLRLDYFRADPPSRLSSRVRLEWSVSAEAGKEVTSADFRVYREPASLEPQADLVPLTPEGVDLPDSLHGLGAHRFTDAEILEAGTYRYWIECSADGETAWPDPVTVTVASWSDEALGVWPNPTSGLTQLVYTLDSSEPVSLSVYDTAGRTVGHLTKGPSGRGRQEWRIDDLQRACTLGLPEGIYFLRLQAGTRSFCGRVVLLKDREP